MRPLQKLFIILIVSIGCSERSDVKIERTDLQRSELNYKLIRDDLFVDDLGKIYHRTIDVSAADSQKNPEDGKVYAYRDYLRLDTVINGEKTFECIDLKDIVDTASFHRVAQTEADANYEVYEDKNMRYFLWFVSDGGTLEASRKKTSGL